MMGRLLLSASLCLVTLPVMAAEDAFVTRPLFSADRRPAPEQAASPFQPGRELPTGNWRLTGLATGADGRTIILLTGIDSGQVLRAHPGDSVNGWLILDAGGHVLRLTRRGEMHQTALRQALPE